MYQAIKPHLAVLGGITALFVVGMVGGAVIGALGFPDIITPTAQLLGAAIASMTNLFLLAGAVILGLAAQRHVVLILGGVGLGTIVSFAHSLPPAWMLGPLVAAVFVAYLINLVMVAFTHGGDVGDQAEPTDGTEAAPEDPSE